MSNPIIISNSGPQGDDQSEQQSSRISVPEIARQLKIGRVAVYAMLAQGIIPGIRLGRRWIVTRHAFEQWERTCGVQAGAGLVAQPEVTVVLN
jgi:excisionase family DNA binding protein